MKLCYYSRDAMLGIRSKLATAFWLNESDAGEFPLSKSAFCIVCVRLETAWPRSSITGWSQFLFVNYRKIKAQITINFFRYLKKHLNQKWIINELENDISQFNHLHSSPSLELSSDEVSSKISFKKQSNSNPF